MNFYRENFVGKERKWLDFNRVFELGWGLFGRGGGNFLGFFIFFKI